MASELNALKEAEKTLKAALGELEQHVAQMPLANAKQVVESVGQQVISAGSAENLCCQRRGQPADFNSGEGSATHRQCPRQYCCS